MSERLRIEGFFKAPFKVIAATIKSLLFIAKRLRKRLLTTVPFLALTLFTFVRAAVMYVVLPLYDVVSDLVVAYHYHQKEELYVISGLILFFVLLPHLVQSTFLVFEMIANVGAFDDYPKFIVDFYQYNPTPSRLLNLVLKLATLPLFAVFHFFLFFINMFAYALRAVLRVRSKADKIHSDTVGQRPPQKTESRERQG